MKAETLEKSSRVDVLAKLVARDDGCPLIGGIVGVEPTETVELLSS